MYSDEIKKDCRIIHTGLKGKKNLEIINSVQGQLSDGMWENSPTMECYWRFFTVDSVEDEVVIYVSNQWGERYYGKIKYNRFKDKTDTQIKEWFANKIKQIIKAEIEDWPSREFIWKRNCQTISHYFCYNEHITVADAYKAYDILKERSEILRYGVDK